jgi:hypothetical protein
MGKRELLLIVAFVLGGAVVYHVSAPPPAPGEQSFSLGQLVENFRRHVRGNRASAESTTTTHHAVGPSITELRVNSRMGTIVVIGEDRTDIEAELRAQSNGFDDAEAQRLVQETKLLVSGAGNRLVAGVVYPRAGTQRTLRLKLKVPARLLVTLDGSGGPLELSGVAGVELSSTRGEARLRNIAGNVTGTHRGGELSVADSASVKLTLISTDVQIERIPGDVSLNIQGGELKGSDIGGAVEIDSQRADISLDKLKKVTGMLRVNAVSGSVALTGLQTDARLDVRNSRVEVAAERAAPLVINSEGGGSIEITPAPGGYQLDAVAARGDVTLPEGTLETTRNGDEHRAVGAVNGGGPAITVRTDRADITVRAR